MNSKNVDTFLAVSEFSSISAAAEALFISPPALQQQLNRLEGEIGFRLFERGPGGIRLTQAGKIFLDGMIKIRSDTEQLMTRCRDADSLNKCLRIGAILGLQPDLFPRLSGPFYQKYPDIVQKPVMESEDQLFSDLDSGTNNASIPMSVEEFYNVAENADIIIYNGSIDSSVASLEDLTGKNAVLANMKAVKEGNCWVTGSSMYQRTDVVGDMIMDFHRIFTEDDPQDLKFISRLR